MLHKTRCLCVTSSDCTEFEFIVTEVFPANATQRKTIPRLHKNQLLFTHISFCFRAMHPTISSLLQNPTRECVQIYNHLPLRNDLVEEDKQKQRDLELNQECYPSPFSCTKDPNPYNIWEFGLLD